MTDLAEKKVPCSFVTINAKVLTPLVMVFAPKTDMLTVKILVPELLKYILLNWKIGCVKANVKNCLNLAMDNV